MHTRTVLITVVLVVVAATMLLLWGAVLSPPKKSEKIQDPRSKIQITSPSVTFIDPVRGNRDAKIKIIEYGDFYCTACAEVDNTLKAVLAKHPEAALVWKSVPDTRIHIGSDLLAYMGACAAREGKFWDFHDRIFTSQTGLTPETGLTIASDLGLGATFRSCVDNKETKPLVDRTIEEAVALGIDGTPYFFIGKTRISGAASAAEFEQAISSP